MSDLSPKPYGKTRELEISAISTFENLVDKSRINTFISRDNTLPDTDGYIVIIDEQTIPTCKFEVQIKKLPDKNEGNPKIPCPLSIFGYAQSFFYPFLFIAVDIHNNKAYWIHISDALLDQYHDNIKANQDTITLHFPKENFIDGNDTKYIKAWEKIFQNQATKLKNYDNLERQYALLKEHSNPILDVSRHEFGEIHTFLDNINQILEAKFPIVKRIYFSNAWKIGIAYFEYTENRVDYSLYPIPFDKNDVQIKVIDDHLKKKLEAEHLDVTGYYQENPIKIRPQNYSLEVIESKIFRILEHRLLDHKNEFLAREYVFAFIDKFSVQLGLEIKNNYTIEEIETAFFRYLPHWTNEAVQHLTLGKRKNKIDSSNYLFRKFFFDPDLINCLIMPDEKASIDERVRTRLENNNPVPRIPMGNEKFPFGTFFELFTFIKSLGVNDIQRVYLPKDCERLRKGSGLVWNFYSPEQVKENLSIFFTNLDNVYTCLIGRNFPEIKDDLSIFGSANRIIVVYNVKEHYDSFHRPTINFYFLVDESLDKIVFELYNHDEVPVLPSLHQISSNRDFSIKGRKYKIIAASQGKLGFIFDDLPMMDYCYKLFKDNLKRYFKKLKQE